MSHGSGRSARVDYLIASRLGRAPVIRPVADFWRNYDGDQSAACGRAARFELTKSDNPHKVLDFYNGFWTAISNLSLLAMLVLGLTLKALNLGPKHAVIVAVLLAPFLFLTISSVMLMAIAFIRRSRMLGADGAVKHVSASLESTAGDWWAAVFVGAAAAAAAVLGVILG